MMTFLIFFMDFEFIIISIVSIVLYWILEHALGKGYVKRWEHKRAIADIGDELGSIDESFTKFRAKYSTKFAREAKDEQAQELEACIPEILGSLNLTDKQKQMVSRIPPAMITAFLKKQKLL